MKNLKVNERLFIGYEFAAFTNIDNTVKKILITNDDIDYSTSTVYHYKLKDFLMMEEL